MKALVLKTQGSRAAVLLTDGSFRVARGDFSIGETFDYPVAAKPALRQLLATAAAMIVMLGAAAGWWVDRNYVPYAEISLDVNPSIVYSVNKRNRVLSVSAVNGDAKGIVETLEQEGVQFASVPDAVGRTLSLLEDEGYLDEAKPDYVLVNVSADDESRQDSIVTQVETAMRKLADSNPTVEYRIERSDRETAREAEDSGMSPGRYAAWKAAVEAGPENADLGEYAEKPVSEIIDAMPEDRGRPKAPVDESRSPGEPTAPEDGAAAQAKPEPEAAPERKDAPKGEPAAKPDAAADPVEAPSGVAEKPQESVPQHEPVEHESDSPAEPGRQDGEARETPPSPDDKAGDTAQQEAATQQERPVQDSEEKPQESAPKPRDTQPESANDNPGGDVTPKENASKDDPVREKAPQAPESSEKERLPVGNRGQEARAHNRDGNKK